MTFFVNFFVAAVLMGTTLMYGTLGEILTEKAGNMNLGVEGLIYMGGSSGLIAAFLYERAAGQTAIPLAAAGLAFLAAFLAAGLGSLLYAFLTITLRTNQNVTGLALTIFGVGYGEFFGEYFRTIGGGRLQISEAAGSIFSQPLLPAFLRDLPIVGKLLFSYNFMIYLVPWGPAAATGPLVPWTARAGWRWPWSSLLCGNPCGQSGVPSCLAL